MTTGERLRAAVLCLEGPALSWYRWSEGREPFRSWEELKRRLLNRFQSSQEGSLHEQFFAISQTGTAREYVTLFERMAAQLPRLPEEVLDGVFVKGLKPELRTTVRAHQPSGLSQAMELALVIDESRSHGGTEPSKVATYKPSTRSNGTSSKAPREERSTTTGKAPFKRLTETEIADKRAKGLCYRCDGKYGPGHRCPEKFLQVLLVSEEENEDETSDQEEEEPV